MSLLRGGLLASKHDEQLVRSRLALRCDLHTQDHTISLDFLPCCSMKHSVDSWVLERSGARAKRTHIDTEQVSCCCLLLGYCYEPAYTSSKYCQVDHMLSCSLDEIFVAEQINCGLATHLSCPCRLVLDRRLAFHDCNIALPDIATPSLKAVIAARPFFVQQK